MEELKTVQQLFDLAGGSVKIAAKLMLNQHTVDRWEKGGVPQKHWGVLMPWLDVTAQELHTITENARNAFRKKVNK